MSLTKTNQLILFSEIITVDSKNSAEHMYTLGKLQQFYVIKEGITHNNHLKSYLILNGASIVESDV